MELTKEQLRKERELYSQLVNKSWRDASFKEKLIKNPLKVIEDFTNMDIKLPEGRRILVEDQSDDSKIFINIPAKPDLDELDLTEEQLEMISGGTTTPA